MADARWHATVARSANKEIGQPIRSSAANVNEFWHWSLSPNDDLLDPSFKNGGQRGVG